MANGYTSAERRANVRKQLRDRKGRWIEMGAKVRFTLDGIERAGEIVDIDYDNDEALVAFRGKNGKLTETKLKGRDLDVIANKATLDSSSQKKATLPEGKGKDKADLDAKIAELEEEEQFLKDTGASKAEIRAVQKQREALVKERDGNTDADKPEAAPTEEKAASSVNTKGESIDIDEIDALEDGTTVELHDTANDNDITVWRKDRGSWLGYDDDDNEHELTDDELKDYINARDPKDITAYRDDDERNDAKKRDKLEKRKDDQAAPGNRRNRHDRDRESDMGPGLPHLPGHDRNRDDRSNEDDENRDAPVEKPTDKAEETPAEPKQEEPKSKPVETDEGKTEDRPAEEPAAETEPATQPDSPYAPDTRLTDPGQLENAPRGTRVADDQTGDEYTRLGESGWRSDTLDPISSEDLAEHGAIVKSSSPVANSEGDLQNGETKTGLDPDTVTLITDPKVASRLADTVEGDDNNAEFIRNALNTPAEFGEDVSRVYVKTDSDGNVVGAASTVDYSYDPDEFDLGYEQEPFNYVKLDYLGSQKGSGSGSALVARVLSDAREQDRGVLLEATPESRSYWEEKQGFKEDPYGAGMSAYGLTPEQIDEYFSEQNKPAAGDDVGPDADLSYEDSHSELVPAAEVAGNTEGAEQRLTAAPEGTTVTDAAGNEYTKHGGDSWEDSAGKQVGSGPLAQRGADLPKETTEPGAATLSKDELDALPPGAQVESASGDGFIKGDDSTWLDDDDNEVSSTEVADADVTHVSGQTPAADVAPAGSADEADYTAGKTPVAPDGVSVVDNFDADYRGVSLAGDEGNNSGYRADGEPYRHGDTSLTTTDLDRLPLGTEVSSSDGAVYQKSNDTGNWDRLNPPDDAARYEASWDELDAAQGDEGFTFETGREHQNRWEAAESSDAPAEDAGKDTTADEVETAPGTPEAAPGGTAPGAGEDVESGAETTPGTTDLEPAEDGVVKTATDGRKYVAARDGSALFEGDKVVSAKDGLVGTVVRIEPNGKYVQVLGDDGKKRGRRATSLDRQADEVNTAPVPTGEQTPAGEAVTPSTGDNRLVGEDGEPYIMGADGADELRVGYTVKSRTDGLEGEIVGIEKNGAYVRVRGEDGKVRGRKADTLDRTISVYVDVIGESSAIEELKPGLFLNHDTGRKYVQNSKGVRFHSNDVITNGVDSFRVETANVNKNGKPMLFLDRLTPDGVSSGMTVFMSGSQLDDLFSKEDKPSITDSSVTPESLNLSPGEYAAKMYADSNFELAGAPEQGAMGLVHFISLPDGSQALVKTVTGTHWKEWSPDTMDMEHEQALDYELHAEYLGAKVAEALGIPSISSAIVPGSKNKVVHLVVPGQDAFDTLDLDEINPEDILDYKGGVDTSEIPGFESLDYKNAREIALFDYLTGYEDRHLGNWFIDEENKAVYPVDFGAAWIDVSTADAGPSPFFYHWFDPDYAPSMWTAEELAELRGKLEDLEDEFYDANKGAWFNLTMQRLDDLESEVLE